MTTDLSTIYPITDNLMRQYLTSTDAIKKEWYLADVKELARGIMIKNAVSFHARYNVTQLSVHELFNIAVMGQAFYEAIKRWDPNANVYFLQYWRIQAESAMLNLLRSVTSNQARFHENALNSPRDTESALDSYEAKAVACCVDVEEEVIRKDDELLRLFHEFIETDRRGRLLEREALPTLAKSTLTKELLGDDVPKANNRRIAYMTRKRFLKFCESKGFNLERYLSER